jgi:hypothetical protein
MIADGYRFEGKEVGSMDTLLGWLEGNHLKKICMKEEK